MTAHPTLTPPRISHSGARMFLGSMVALLWLGALSLHAAHPRVVITPTPGFGINWDGNNGGFNSPDAGAGPSNNVALASNGTVPFSSSDLGPELGIPFHVAANLNDGLYGNLNSWISGSAPDPYAALRFAASVDISSIAWSRDNGLGAGDSCGGTCTDRAVGTYTLQVTQVPNPDTTTPDTGDAATGWATIGTVQYLPGANDASFSDYLRHRFDVTEGGNPIAATGIRIKVSVGGLGGGLAIDEIEVNPIADLVPPITNFIEITPAPGFAINWDRNEGNFSTPAPPAPVPVNDASTSRGATAFGSTELGPALGIAFHRFFNVNDGLYGNSHSWIANFPGGDPAPFIGINFGARRLLSSVAWSRDNGDAVEGTFTDRTLGVYVLQVTAAPNPGPATPEACAPTPDSGWVTVGTINFKANNLSQFNSHLRHRFDVTQNGAPIAATGIRIKVPDASIAIDEIEVNSNLAIENNALRIASAPDATIRWDGNNGQFENPAAGAAPPPNRALATEGTTPFTSSDLGPALSIPFHRAVNLNDGLYGNANSWISANGIGGTSDPDPFAGLSFGGTVSVTNIAWGRDNGNATEGTFGDRALDSYRIQFTFVAAPDATTPDTGDAATGWQDIGTVTYASAAPPFFTPYLRHRFDIAAGGLPIEATAIRIKVASGNTAIDEIEINTSAGAPPPPSPVGLSPAPGYAIAWDGNDGHYQNPAVGARPPANRALASQGSTPFTSSDLGPLLSIPFHVAANLNDGLYGNSHSWISANGLGGTSDPDPFAGINFDGPVLIRNIAWSRDNGDVPGDCCGGTVTDRALGTYTLQITTVSAPDAATPETGDAATGWATIAAVEYRRAAPGDFTPHLRHRFDVSSDGQPLAATGLRIKVSNGSMDIDEIEVNTATTPPPCCNAEPSFTLAGTTITSDEDAGAVSVAGWVSNLSAGANEPNQTVTIHLNNDNPALFATPPAIGPNGELTYTPAPETSGSANVSIYVTDDGGTGVCGDDTSASQSFTINVRTINDCPVSAPASLTLVQDTQINFQLQATDAEGDPLQYETTQNPSHGSLAVNGNTGAASYTPAPGYCGPDSFRYRVNDGQCPSAAVTVSISVQCLNRCPTAVAQAGPECRLEPDASTVVILSVNNSNAVVLLDGTLSSDPDGDALTYVWLLDIGGMLTPVASGATAAGTLPVGLNNIMLLVDDGRCANTALVAVEVITVCEAVEQLILKVDDAVLDRRNKRPLIASLKAACASFERGSCVSGVNQLRAFIHKTQAQILEANPAEADQFIRFAEKIIGCVECPEEDGN